MNNIVKKSITWHYAHDHEINQNFNPELKAYLNLELTITVSIHQRDTTSYFTVLNLETAKSFANHILEEVEKAEKLSENGGSNG